MSEKRELIKGRADGLVVNTSRVVTAGAEYTITDPSINPNHYPHWGILRVPTTGERFLLTDRSFTGRPFANGGIDKFFGNIPSRLIREIQQNKGVVNVVDIGGGKKSASAKEIAETYPWTVVTNIDLVIEQERTNNNLTEKPGSILEIPLEDHIADLVYTHQVVPFLTKDRAKIAVAEVARLLVKGGFGIIDDGYFSHNEQEVKKLEQDLGLQVTTAPKSYGERFLLLYG